MGLFQLLSCSQILSSSSSLSLSFLLLMVLALNNSRVEHVNAFALQNPSSLFAVSPLSRCILLPSTTTTTTTTTLLQKSNHHNYHCPAQGKNQQQQRIYTKDSFVSLENLKRRNYPPVTYFEEDFEENQQYQQHHQQSQEEEQQSQVQKSYQEEQYYDTRAAAAVTAEDDDISWNNNNAMGSITEESLSSSSSSSSLSSNQPQGLLERQVLRLESLEIYVLVSVLTATSSRQALGDEIAVVIDPSNSMAAMMPTLLLLVATLSTFTGIYATIVFSLVVLYGKTLLGMERCDEEGCSIVSYEDILNETSQQRLRGFYAFIISLMLFVTEIGILAMEKLPSEIEVFVGIGSFACIAFIGAEVSTIIDKAKPIFNSSTNKKK